VCVLSAAMASSSSQSNLSATLAALKQSLVTLRKGEWGKDGKDPTVDDLDRIIRRIREARPLYKDTSSGAMKSTARVPQLKFYCPKCGNNKEDDFLVDKRTGDCVCKGVGESGCGFVVADHFVDQGSSKRNFEEDETDKRYFGPKPNLLMPDSYNMRTMIQVGQLAVIHFFL